MVDQPGQCHSQAEAPGRVGRTGWCGKESLVRDRGVHSALRGCAGPAGDRGGSSSHSEVFAPSCC